jgi:CubicO group peptidase (beta-lactamase class C family)
MPGSQQPPDAIAPGFARLEASLLADIDGGRCDGVAMRVTQRGRTLYEGVHGFADRAAGRPLAPGDVFVSMSVGKQFTNMVLLGLIEEGRLSLNTQLAEVLDAFKGPAWRGATIAQLFMHSAGVLPAVPQVPPDMLIRPERLAAFVAASGPQYTPGTRIDYSIIAAHAVLAEIARAIDGGTRSFAEIVRERLFIPLGMHDTFLGPREDLLARACPVKACYDTPGLADPRALEGLGALLCIPGGEVPAGGYFTTLGDLQRFVDMLASGGALDGRRVLSRSMLAFCTRNRSGDRPNHLWDYTRAFRGWEPWPACLGYGFYVRGDCLTPGPFGVLNSEGTFGGIGAGSTAFWVDPERALGVVFLSSGLMEDSYHLQRLQRLSDLAILACEES